MSTFNTIGIFVDSDHAPAGLLEGLKEAALSLGIPDIRVLQPQDLPGFTASDTIFIAFWTDDDAAAMEKLLFDRSELPTFFLNQPWVRSRCNTFGTEGEFLRYSWGFPNGAEFLQKDPDTTFEVNLKPWRTVTDDMLSVIIPPTDAAAVFHGETSMQSYLEKKAQEQGLTNYAISVHPKVAATLPPSLAARNLKLDDALVRASSVHTLQSGAAFRALLEGIIVYADPLHHPIGSYARAFNNGRAENIDRLDLFQRVARYDIPANSAAIATELQELVNAYITVA